MNALWPEVIYAAPTCALHCDPAQLEAPLTTADPSLRALLDRYARTELEALPPVPTTESRVVEHLLQALPGPAPAAAAVARALGLSPRSLRRALHGEGTTFSEVRDRCLRRVAEDALRDPARTIGEVAWLLGYSEPSAFHRAFRRWTGTTPRAVREGGRIRSGPGPEEDLH